MRSPHKVPRIVFSLCLLFLALPFFTGHAAAQQEEAEFVDGIAWIIPIKGTIEPSLATFVRREARRAIDRGANVLIFEIDTFGGRVDSALQIASFIMSIRNAKTVAWVTYGEESMGVSWSAGALIALACSEIYMAPGTSIGAVAPVDGSGQPTDEKTVSAVRSQMRALAERNNHPVGIALAMVDYDVELWEVEVNDQIMALTVSELERLERDIRDEVDIHKIRYSEVGKLLTLSAGEAHRLGLTAGLADSREDLLVILDVHSEIVESFPSLADDVISFFTSQGVQIILILLGLVMIFMEIQSPGIGVPGTIAILAFLIVFGSGALLGRVGSLEIILFIIGVGLLAIEIFVTPGFGLMGITGILIIGTSLVLSMQDFVIPEFDWEWDLLGRNVMVVFVSILASIVGIAIIALLSPKIKIFDRLMLKTAITGTSGGPDPDFSADKAPAEGSVYNVYDEENFSALVGKIGTTDSILRPSGRALFEGNVYTVEADGEFIDAGRGVVVTRVKGNRIIVKRV